MTVNAFLPSQGISDELLIQSPHLFHDEEGALSMAEAAEAIAVIARCALVDFLREGPGLRNKDGLARFAQILSQDLGAPVSLGLEFAKEICNRLDEAALCELSALGRPVLG